MATNYGVARWRMVSRSTPPLLLVRFGGIRWERLFGCPTGLAWLLSLLLTEGRPDDLKIALSTYHELRLNASHPLTKG